jgi:hypothetical protein
MFIKNNYFHDAFFLKALGGWCRSFIHAVDCWLTRSLMQSAERSLSRMVRADCTGRKSLSRMSRRVRRRRHDVADVNGAATALWS